MRVIVRPFLFAGFLASMLCFAVLAIPTTTRAQQIFTDYLWVPCFEDDSVYKVNVEDHQVEAVIAVGDGPGGIAVGADYVYVTHRYTPYVYRISKTTDQVVDSINFGPWMAATLGVAVDTNGYFYVAGRKALGGVSQTWSRFAKVDPSGVILDSTDLVVISGYADEEGFDCIGLSLDKTGIAYLPWMQTWDAVGGIVTVDVETLDKANHGLSVTSYGYRGPGISCDQYDIGWTCGSRQDRNYFNGYHPDSGYISKRIPLYISVGRGDVAVDNANNIWTGNSLGYLIRYMPAVDDLVIFDVGSRIAGLAIDKNGYLWAALRNDSAVVKFDLNGNQVGDTVRVGNMPLGFGDMTGFELEYNRFTGPPVIAITHPNDSAEYYPDDSITVYVSATDTWGIDSVVIDIFWNDTNITMLDGVKPFEFAWQIPVDIENNTSITLAAAAYPTASYTVYDTVVIVAKRELPNITVSPENDSTSFGGYGDQYVTLVNTSKTSRMYYYGIVGINASWLSKTIDSAIIVSGATLVDSFSVELPSDVSALADTGTYTPAYFITDGSADTNFIQTTLYVSPYVYIENRIPESNANVVSENLLLQLTTSGPAVCTIILRQIDNPDWQEYVTTTGYTHQIYLQGLTRDAGYEWYVEAEAAWGYITESDIDTFHVVNGVVFTDDTIKVSVTRAYDQHIDVSCENTDSLAYFVQAYPLNYPEELAVGFIGEGSPDEPRYSIGPEQFIIDLGIHTQDVGPGIYNFDLTLESWREDTALMFLPVVLTVVPPVLSVDAQVIAVDSQTLAHTVRIINLGDTITNLSILLPDSIFNAAYVMPQVEHLLLGTSDTVSIEVVPYLTIEDEKGDGIEYNKNGIIAKFPSLLLLDNSGDLEIWYDGELLRVPLDFTPPPDLEVFLGTAEDVRFCVERRSWYCTNKPDISVGFITPSGIDPADVSEGVFSVYFSPRSSYIPRHDVDIYFNGDLVGELDWLVPHGEYAFIVEGDNINFASEGNAVNTARINTHWKTGGHYSAVSEFNLCLCLDSYSQYVLAETQQEADAIVSNLPQLRQGVGNLEITIDDPMEAAQLVKLAPVKIQATVAEDGDVPHGISVVAEFSNGDNPVILYDDGSHGDGAAEDGVYANTWEPYNLGMGSVSIKAGLCGNFTLSDPLHFMTSPPQIHVIAPTGSDTYDDVQGAKCQIYRNDEWLNVLGETDENGLIAIGTIEENGGGTYSADLSSDEVIRVYKVADEFVFARWPKYIRDAEHISHRITIDSDTIRANGTLGHCKSDLSQTLDIPLEHTLLRFNLTVGINWNEKANSEFVTNLKAGLRKMGNFMYDAFDGQAVIDTVWLIDRIGLIGDSDEGDPFGIPAKDEMDLKISAANDRNSAPGANPGKAFQHDESDLTKSGPAYMPRWWLPDVQLAGTMSVDFDNTRVYGSRVIPDWSLDDFGSHLSNTYRSAYHELSHAWFNISDEYCGLESEFGFTESKLKEIGIMIGTLSVWSEYSSDADYDANTELKVDRQCGRPPGYPNQWKHRGMSCWSALEENYESDQWGFLNGIPIYLRSPKQPVATEGVPDRGAELNGPNDENYGTGARVNIGADLVFIDDYIDPDMICDDRGPNYFLLRVRKCGGILGLQDVKNAKVSLIKDPDNTDGKEWSINQGRTDNDGYLMILGICYGDRLNIRNSEGKSRDYLYSEDSGDEDELIFECDQIGFKATGVADVINPPTNELHIAITNQTLELTALPIATIYPEGKTGFTAPLSLAKDQLIDGAIPLDSGLVGVLEISVVDTLDDTTRYAFGYAVTHGDTLYDQTYLASEDGSVFLMLDEIYGNNNTLSILTVAAQMPSLPSEAAPVSPAFHVSFGDLVAPLTGVNLLMVDYPDIEEIGYDELGMTIQSYDTATQAWQVMTAYEHDALNNIITANISEPGIYGLFMSAPDPDVDGIPSYYDNCPTVYNPDQADADSDGIGDVCENCCITHAVAGDANSDLVINLLDILHVISYVYQEPPGYPPNPEGCDALLDCNGDGVDVENPTINLLDILAMIEHIYQDPVGSPVMCCPPGCQVP
ncbi:MAG: hypothetical protein JW763_05640 [candidate division Zixibacteria bacterium]|nr:hypothetical protein [candidate division Zixibacteria bacterium]